MKNISSAAAAVLSLFLLSACVTEVTNPVFDVEKSDTEALEDYLQLAVGYLEQDDLASARRHLSNAAAIDANNSEIYAIRALINIREGEADLADDNFRRSLRLDGNNSKARNNYAAFLFAEGRIDEAYNQLQRVVQDTEYPQRPQAFENMGIAAMRLDRMNDAEQAFNRAVQLNPNQLRSTLELAKINLERNNIPQASAYWRSYLTLIQFFRVGHNARSLLTGAKLELAQGNRNSAMEYGDLLKNNFPDSPEYEEYQQAIK